MVLIYFAVGFPPCFTDSTTIHVKQSHLFTLLLILSSFEGLQLSGQQAPLNHIMFNAQVRGH